MRRELPGMGRALPGVGGQPVVVVAGASARAGGRDLWQGLDVEVAPGDLVAVLGPNGVGKSTLVRAVLGLHRLSAGHIEVLGRPAGQANRSVGYMPQRRSYDRGVRIRARDVVRLGLDGTRWGVPLPWPGGRRRQEAARVEEVLALVGASHLADRPVGQVSGGEQQRVLIAQALVNRPRLLLMDEPLDSLDLPTQGAIAALVRGICRAQGVAAMIVAHDVNPILTHLDKVVYLGPSRAVVGRPAEVVTGPVLSDLYGSPVEVLTAGDGRLVVVGVPEAPAHHADRHGHDQSDPAGPPRSGRSRPERAAG
ncbi:MAG: metal ABC transporter ATP-binding protein [Acidimicrobiales bacterium]